MRRVIENVESACSAAYGLVKMNEHIDQLATGIDQTLVWEPLGAFLIVTPGNIPMHAWSSFVPYALAAGCTVVVSPSPHDPVAAVVYCRPNGVDLSVINGNIVVQEGRLTTVDMPPILERHRTIARAMVRGER